MNRVLLALGLVVLAASIVVFFPSLSVRQPCSRSSYTELGTNGTRATIYLCPDGTDNPTYIGPDFSSLNIGVTLAIMGAILAIAGVVMRSDPSEGGTWEKTPKPPGDGQEA